MDTLEQWASRYKALSEPLRIRLLCLVIAAGDICVCDLVTITGASQSKVSRHLAYLKNSGWLAVRREKLWMHYSIAKQDGDMEEAVIKTLKKHAKNSRQIKKDLEKLAEKAGSSGKC